MLSVIILCPMMGEGVDAPTAPDTIVRTLSALVGILVRGLIRDVVLVGPKEASLAMIADHAGCAVIEAAHEAEGIDRALALVRGEALIVLRSGHIPETGFVEELEDLMAVGLREGRRIYAAPATYWERLVPALAPVVGLVAPVKLCRMSTDGKTLSLAALLRATRATSALRARMRRLA